LILLPLKTVRLPSVVATVVYGVGVNGIAVDWVAVAAKAAKGLAGLAGLSGLLSLSTLLGLDICGGGAGENTSADSKGSNENGELHSED